MSTGEYVADQVVAIARRLQAGNAAGPDPLGYRDALVIAKDLAAIPDVIDKHPPKDPKKDK